MAFFYEALPCEWKYKETSVHRYGSSNSGNHWETFDAKTCRKLETIFKRIEKKDFSRVELQWTNKSNNNANATEWTINVQNYQGVPQKNVGYYNRQMLEISRGGYPYPNSGNIKESKLKSLFAKYADPEDEDYMGDEQGKGIYKLLSDCGCDLKRIESLILHCICDAEALMTIERDRFVAGMKKCGCYDIKSLRERIKEIRSKVLSKGGKKHLKSLSERVYRLCCARDNQRSLPIVYTEDDDEDPPIQVFPTSLTVFPMMYCNGMDKIFPYGAQFLEFLKLGPLVDGERVKSITVDDWKMIAEFLHEVKTEAQFNSEKESDWVLIIDAFLNWNVADDHIDKAMMKEKAT